jgi:N-methylhydantoinase B
VAPLLVWKKRLRTDSGGPGTFRGGLGQEIEIEVRTEQAVRLSLLSDRHKHPPYGVRGGMHGAPSVITLDDGHKPHPKSRTSVDAGRRVTLLYAGGGGYGDPKLRNRDAVKADLRDGYISAEAAKRDYGLE